MTRRTLTVTEIARNLRAVRRRATAENVTEGRAWYPANRRLLLTFRDDAADVTGDYGGVSDRQAIGVFAAFSQNSTWAANLTMGLKYLQGYGAGMGKVLAECEAIDLRDADPTDYAVMSAAAGQSWLKRADFAANLLGDMERVTCDRWHLAAAFKTAAMDPDRPETFPRGVGRTRDNRSAPWRIAVKLTKETHAAVTEATRRVAAEYGETPAECQAVIWCAMRGTGE